jgi:hypothetical protein
MFLTPVVLYAQVEPSPVAEEKPAEATPAPAKPAEPEKPGWKTVIGARLDGGFALRRLYDIPMQGADIGGAIGAQPIEHGAFWGTVRAFVGSTEAGLRVVDIHVGAEGEAVIDRFRIGGGIGIMWLGVSRVTSDQSIKSWGPDFRAHARFDLIQAEAFAIYARVAISFAHELYDSANFWGPTFGGGIDFDLVRHRPRE